MNIKTYQTKLFAFNHYLKLLKTKSLINNSPPKQSSVVYTSRNLTHMNRYEEQLKTVKLVNKIIQIHNADIISTKSKNKSFQKKLTRKNRKLTFTDNQNYTSFNKTLANSFKTYEKKLNIEEKNFDMIQRLSATQSNYKKAFSKERVKKLRDYSKILIKSNPDQEIRDYYFGLYENLKICQIQTKNPRRPKRRKKLSKSLTESTRPQTAR